MKGLILYLFLSVALVGCHHNHPEAKQPEPVQDIKAEEQEVDEALENILNQLDELDKILDGKEEEQQYE